MKTQTLTFCLAGLCVALTAACGVETITSEQEALSLLESDPAFKKFTYTDDGASVTAFYWRDAEGKARYADDIVLAEAGEPVPGALPEEPTADGIGVRRQASVVLSSTSRRWPNRTVPYIIDPYFLISDAVNGTKYVQQIQAGMNMWRQATSYAINFMPRRPFDKDYIYIKYSTSECSSMVGRRGGQQYLRLEAWCVKSPGIVAHELGHALGLQHEHQSPGRNQFIRINWENVDPGALYNFLLITSGVTASSYDFDSIMHYSATQASRNGQATITPHPLFARRAFGQRDHISTGDVQGLRSYYGW